MASDDHHSAVLFGDLHTALDSRPHRRGLQDQISPFATEELDDAVREVFVLRGGKQISPHSAGQISPSAVELDDRSAKTEGSAEARRLVPKDR